MAKQTSDQEAYEDELIDAAQKILMGHQAGDGSDREIIQRLQDKYGRGIHATLSAVYTHYLRANCPPEWRDRSGVPNLRVINTQGPLAMAGFLTVVGFEAEEEHGRELHQATLWAQRLLAEPDINEALNFTDPRSWGSRIKDEPRLLEFTAMCLCVCCICVNSVLPDDDE